MPYFRVSRKVYEDYPIKEWDNEFDAEADACNDTEGWEFGDVEYYVEEVDPVEFGVISQEEMLTQKLMEAKGIIRDLSAHTFGLNEDQVERIEKFLTVKV